MKVGLGNASRVLGLERVRVSLPLTCDNSNICVTAVKRENTV